jgi:RNA polymerase sigma-70 factor, ECF subfamily
MSQPTDPTEIDARLGRAWREHRRYVLDIALRMLGDLGDAEDVVQEAFTRLLRTEIDEIDDVRGWLVTVVSRLCLDQLRSARRQRQQPLDDPGRPASSSDRVVSVSTEADPADPADRVTLDDSIRLALHVMLERLSPAERAAFVLHDVFQLAFEDIAGIVGRSPAACRQLASRARRHVTDDGNPARFAIETAEHRDVTERFISACASGDFEALLAVLDPDVSGQGEVGGTVGLRPPVVGRHAVAAGVLAYLGPHAGTTAVSLPTGRQPSVAVLRDNRVVAVVTLTIRDGLVHHIHALADPVKLAPITATLQS